EAELVAAETGVEIPGSRTDALGLAARRRPLLRNEVVGSDLFSQQSGDPFDDAIADGVSQRVVVPLEAGDIDQTDGAPSAPLLESQKGLELLGEPPEIHQLGFGIAVGFVGE